MPSTSSDNEIVILFHTSHACLHVPPFTSANYPRVGQTLPLVANKWFLFIALLCPLDFKVFLHFWANCSSFTYKNKKIFHGHMNMHIFKLRKDGVG